MATLHYAFNGESACALHRVVMPARFCNPHFAPLGHAIQFGAAIPDDAEWFGVHGLLDGQGAVRAVQRQRKGQKFLWSLDDDFLSIPEWNPADPGEEGRAVWDICAVMANLIVVSTPALASALSRYAHKVVVAPNLMDLDQFPLWEPHPEGERATEITLPVKVGWSGGITHKKDVEVVIEPLLALLKRFPPHLMRVVWFGPTPPTPLLRDHLGKGLWWQPMEKLAVYQPMLRSIDPDVWLAPMDKCQFNLSKSAIRVYEAWGLQAVPVATPWGEYACIESGADGRLCDSPASWVSALERLVGDHAYRLEMAERGRIRVGRDHDWNRPQCRAPWLNVYARVFGCAVPECASAGA